MKRSAPIKRKTPVNRRRSKPRRSSRRLDPGYLARVRELPCVVAEHNSCAGVTEAHHMGPRGLGQKCSDDESVPLCNLHHRCWHDCIGPFLGKSKDWRAGFATWAIERTRERLAPKPVEVTPW
jgi:hypothetical protein